MSLADVTTKKRREKHRAHTKNMKENGRSAGVVADDINNVVKVIRETIR